MFKNKHILFLSMCNGCMCACERRSPWNPEEGPGFPGARVTGSYELPQVCAENQIHVLWRSNTVCFRAELSLQPKKVTLKQLCGTRCSVRTETGAL